MQKFKVPKNPRVNEDYTTTSIRIKAALLERIDQIVAESGQSRNEVISLALSFAIENLES